MIDQDTAHYRRASPTSTIDLRSGDWHLAQSQEIDDNGKVIASATANVDRILLLQICGIAIRGSGRGGVVNGIAGSIQVDVVGSAGMPPSLLS
jgi:hypothetical protein